MRSVDAFDATADQYDQYRRLPRNYRQKQSVKPTSGTSVSEVPTMHPSLRTKMMLRCRPLIVLPWLMFVVAVDIAVALVFPVNGARTTFAAATPIRLH